ncbi:hypothetical protein HBH75_096400 [Parastagonospora nodorum]|nr:hypothetical protein HBH75_096400 [Parastagonospora nodorum]
MAHNFAMISNARSRECRTYEAQQVFRQCLVASNSTKKSHECNTLALAETQFTRSGPLDRHPDKHDAVNPGTCTYKETRVMRTQRVVCVTKNVPAIWSSSLHGSRKGGPRDDGFRRGLAPSGPASESPAE